MMVICVMCYQVDIGVLLKHEACSVWEKQMIK